MTLAMLNDENRTTKKQTNAIVRVSEQFAASHEGFILRAFLRRCRHSTHCLKEVVR